jgi:hypothetical protein
MSCPALCTRIVVMAGTLMLPTLSFAAVCEAKSGATTVALLELYTSEGCSSCPPADRWVNDLPNRGFGTDRIVPLALHVDYWNNLGWTDRFSQAAFSERQRELARRTNSRTVYTPELKLNGREYRRWSRGGLAADLDTINRRPARAEIALRLDRQGQTLRVDGTAALKQQAPAAGLYLALYENNLSTAVQAGENRGSTLKHSFVVHRLIGPVGFDAKGTARMQETLSLDAAWKTPDLGVAAFVQESNGVEVLQALALGVCS